MDEQAKREWVEANATRLRESGRKADIPWLEQYYDETPESRQRELDEKHWEELLRRLRTESERNH